jgi:HrpA-like RNA helicase
MSKLLSLVSSLVVSVAEMGSSVLIFVPGMNEIVGISELIEAMFVPGKRFTCIPVHSDIPFEDQMKVFERTDDDECRVIIATNSGTNRL